MSFNQEIFYSLSEKLTVLGISNSSYNEFNGGLDFYYSDNETDRRITLDLVVEKIGFGNIYSRISFSEVIKLLKKYTLLNPEIYEGILVNYDLLKNKEHWNKTFWKFAKHPLKTKANKNDFQNEIIDHIKRDVLPFFNKFPTIESVNELILNHCDYETFPHYISGNCTLKAMIIMHKCNNPRLEDYIKTKDKEYKIYVDKEPKRWKPYYDEFLSLSKDINI